MIYILLAILSSTSIFVIFKLAQNYSCKLSGLITLNYLVAALLGFGFLMQFSTGLLSGSKSWLPFGILLGILFIVMFYLIGNSSQKAGITVTTLANKLSLVFPVLFSLVYFNEQIPPIKYIGLITATVAVFLTVFKPEIKKTNLPYLLLPVSIFIGSGITDSVVKYVQAVKIEQSETAVFSSVVFFVAFIISLIISIFNKKMSWAEFHSPTVILGVLLGLVNFGSLYFFIGALNKSNLNSSLVFAVVNMSIVLLSALIGKMLFKEKLSSINYAGIFLAVVSIYFLL
jgi:drug/metabolite transporter (DMT)-like permease